MLGYKPAGRGLPPRPSTAAGNRPLPHQDFPPMGPAADISMQAGSNNQNNLIRNRSLGDLYDNYYEPENPHGALPSTLEMPDFNNDFTNTHRRGSSFDAHMQVPSYNNMSSTEYIKPLRLKQNMNEQSSPLINGYQEEWNAPPVQNGYHIGFTDWPGNISQSKSYNGSHVSNVTQPLQSPNSFQPISQTGMNNMSTHIGGGLKSDVSGYGQMHADDAYGQASDDTLPLHPLPAQPGLGPTSITHVNKKPTPVRNYSGIGTSQQSLSNPSVDASTVATDLAAELEYFRQCIKTNPGDQVSQFQLAKQLVDAGDSLVQSIPDQRARNKAREKHVMEALRILKKLVSQQNVDAMFFLADCYGRGAPGLEVDHKEAFSLYQSAAKVGHAAAAYRTAVCCELGNEEGGGTRKDPLKAIQWYKRAAMLGDTPAMYKMGIVLLKGLLGQSRNPREAIVWLKRAAQRADAENPHALHELALLYEQPQGTENSVIRDEAYSFQLFQQAADLGYKFSQFRLGCAYEYGLFNCPISPKQSILWYSRAAAQEEHQSELALSGWYLTGSEGVLQQSDTEAYLWARKAAIAGLAKAEYAMGYFTEVGIGSPGNLDDAKRWYWRAAAQNFPKARERLEDLKRGGNKAVLRPRDKISR